jgi:uncharacterized membrane protein
MNPFDLKSALLAKHAQHVVLIHFPIALFIAGVGFDFAARWTRRAALAAAAYYNLIGAAISVLPVLATGMLAWRWQLEGQRLKGVLLLHLVLGCVSGALIGVVAWIHLRKGTGILVGTDEQQIPRCARNDKSVSYRLALELLTVALVALTGHLGGFLSGVNAPG